LELTHQFTVPAPIDDAWAAFNDLERIAPCFPGASLTSYDGEAFGGLCKVKLGPISLQYTGTGRFVSRDEAAHTAVIEAKGKDKRGNGTAAANVTATLISAGEDATDVTVKTDLNITGKPAQFGRGVMQDVSAKLMTRFAECLADQMQTAPAAEEAAPEPEAATEAPAETTAAEAPAETTATEAPTEVPSASSGVSSAAAQAPPSASSGTSSAKTTPPPTPRPTDDVLDLGEASRDAVLKRVAPMAAAAVALLILFRIIRR
jgi:uncharacterized protein